MPNFVIINHRSGHILAVLDADDAVGACERLDQMEQVPRRYEVVGSLTHHETGYRVYHADEDLPPITDGTHPHQIEMIECACRLAATVRTQGVH